ncbi:MAG: gamma-glutamyltranspeptidase/glutathione hydrolase, partial [Lysobacterales bacterium]
GGNAVDAAVAMGFALAVTLPRAGNIGGSGFMLVYVASENKTIALDYRSMAPITSKDANNRTKSGEIDWDKLTFGAHASGVPGTVAGLYEAWQRYGSMTWAELLQPAYELASRGFVVSPDLSYAITQAGRVLASVPASAAAYLRPDGYVWQPGQKLIQKDLAWSIQQIQNGGADAFYKGALAKRITDAFAKDGKQITMQDLAAYKVKEREPVSTDYRGYQVVSMPPSSAGGITLIQMLNILENFDVGKLEAGSARHIHLLAEVMKRAAANRRTHIGDPDFVDVAIEGYISKKLAKKMAEDINLKKPSKVSSIKPEPVEDYESRDTTHFSVIDAQGNAVSNTYTLGYSFGSGWVAEGTGILFDNQMRNFYISNSAEGKNAFAPGKRMISTMTPTIVLGKEGKPFLVTGTPGGSRIINTILQLLVNVIDFDMRIAEATHQPRIQQGWNSQKLGLEQGFSPDTINILERMGHEVGLEQSIGSTQSIMWRDGKFYGSADPRRPNATALGVIYPPALVLKKAASGN